jgi:hypothetical protein
MNTNKTLTRVMRRTLLPSSCLAPTLSATQRMVKNLKMIIWKAMPLKRAKPVSKTSAEKFKSSRSTLKPPLRKQPSLDNSNRSHLPKILIKMKKSQVVKMKVRMVWKQKTA